jgi:hypothetical protein
MKKGNKLYSIFLAKCPVCQEGDLFESKNPYKLSKVFSMVSHCPVCNQKTEPEPGFYYGAMYVSYAMTVAISCFVGVPMVFFDAAPIQTVLAIAAALVVFSPLTLRYSRMIWFNFFFDFDEDAAKK